MTPVPNNESKVKIKNYEELWSKIRNLILSVTYSFEFQPNVYNRCHDLLMTSMNLGGISILNIKNAHYCCIISKNKATKCV